jgi:uncharacterized protein YecE (DUF72 family)
MIQPNPDGAQTARIRVGTAAWSDHQHFYPRGLPPTQRISYYARHFDVVEVNASYYHVLPVQNYEQWVAKTSDDFVFNVKAFGQLTGHHRGSPADEETFRSFRESYAPLRESGKLGAVLFQFPPWFEATPENYAEINRCAELMADDPLLVEFRNVTWLDRQHRDETLEFLDNLRLSYVTVDAPQIGTGTAPLVPAVTNPRLAYLRLHGRNTETWYKRVETTGERFNYHYNDQELDDLAEKVRVLSEAAREVHVIFNNNMENYAVDNATGMMRRLGLSAPDAQPRQRSLF